MKNRKGIPLLLLALGFFALGTASLVLLSNSEAREPEWRQAGIACVEPVEASYPAPEIKLLDLNLNEAELEDYQGSIVLLNTWATWCPPCRAEMPDLQTFYERYQDQGFSLIGVNIGESQGQVIDFASKYRLTFPLWLDPDEQSQRTLKTISLPYSIVIDREGIVRYAWSGATCLSALERNVAPLILQ